VDETSLDGESTLRVFGLEIQTTLNMFHITGSNPVLTATNI